MAQTQIADIIVPAEFTAYQVENSLVSTALFQSGVLVGATDPEDCIPRSCTPNEPVLLSEALFSGGGIRRIGAPTSGLCWLE
jgi:hypothetical protein